MKLYSLINFIQSHYCRVEFGKHQRGILMIGLVGHSVPFCIVKCLAHECKYTESRGRVGKAQPWRPAEAGGLDDILFNNLTSNLAVVPTDKRSRAPAYP